MPLLLVARERRQAPSQLVGIRCEFCAYMFDEALILRERAEQVEVREAAEAKARGERLAKAASEAARTGQPVDLERMMS